MMKAKLLLNLTLVVLLISCHKHDSIKLETKDSYYFNQTYTFETESTDTDHLYWYLNDEFITKGRSFTIQFKEHGVQKIKAVQDAVKEKKSKTYIFPVEVISTVRSLGKNAIADTLVHPNPERMNLNIEENEYQEGGPYIWGTVSEGFETGLIRLSNGNTDLIEVHFSIAKPEIGHITYLRKDGNYYVADGEIKRIGENIYVKFHGEYFNEQTQEKEVIDFEQYFKLID